MPGDDISDIHNNYSGKNWVFPSPDKESKILFCPLGAI